jgi:PrtD family type I secretion system ABC transporter
MKQSRGRTVIGDAIRHCAQHFAAAVMFSAFVNVLLLAYPVYMFQVYDRVVTGKRIETLIALSVGFALALIFSAIFQWVRGTLLLRASLRLEKDLSDRVFAALLELNGNGRVAIGVQAVRDLDQFRQFSTGRGAIALIDAPFAALFVGILFALDNLIGAVALIGALLLGGMTLANSIATKRLLAKANDEALSSYNFIDAALRGAEAIVGMGMVGRMIEKWRTLRIPALGAQLVASERGVAFNAGLGAARILMQGAVLGVGVLKVMFAGAPFGLIFGAIIVFGFAMRPIDQLIRAWEEYVQVRQGLARLEPLLAAQPRSWQGTPLPRPKGELSCRDVFYAPPGQEQLILRAINLRIPPGESLGLAGLNGSGKTTLARLICGNVKPSRGSVRLDGADLFASERDDLGQWIGYLPQAVSLLPGTVTENISRYGRFSHSDVLKAAEVAGAHNMILKLPKGYDTPIGEGGHPLSGGQRQLIGLARAVAGNPALVVLDEPNSNLDGPSENALISCVRHLKEIGTTLVMITHRPTLVSELDHMVILREGAIVSAGPRDHVFKQVGRPVIVKSSENNSPAAAVVKSS